MIRLFVPIIVQLCLFDTLTIASEQNYTPEEVFPLLIPSCWSTLEALDEYEVYCGTEDDDQNLWFATDQGIVSYDGYSCEFYEFPEGFDHTKSLNIYSKHDSIIYVRNEKGFLMFKDGKWKILKTIQSIETLPHSTIIKSINGSLFTYGQKSIFKIEDDALIPVLEFEHSILDAIRFNNQFWIITTKKIISFDEIEGEFVHEQEHFFECRDKIHVKQTPLKFVTNHHSEIWLVGYHKFPLEYNFETGCFEESNVIKSIGENHLLNGKFYGENKTNLLLFGKGITIRRTSQKWEVLNIGKRMPDHRLFHFFRKNGNLIVGGLGEQTFEIDFNHRRWTYYKNLHFQCEDRRGNQWFISEKGEVIQHNVLNNRWKIHQMDSFDSPNSINCSADGSIWVSGGHNRAAAIAQYLDKKWDIRYYPKLRPNIHFLAFLETSSGDILFGATGESGEMGGIVTYARLSKGVFSPEVSLSPASSPMVSGIVETRDALWFAGEYLYRNDPLNGLTQMPLSNSKAVWIDSMVTDEKKHVWLGLWEDGLFRWNGNEWNHFSQPKQLLSNHVSSMAYDQKNKKLWVGTKKGISLYQSNKNVWIPNAITEDIFLQREATTIKLEHSGAIWINSASRAWFLRTHEIPIPPSEDYFITKRFNPDNYSPLISLHLHERSIIESANIFISWEGIDYKSVTPKSKLTYSYQLNDREWSDFTSETSKVFLDLSPGKYQVSIRCRDLDGNISTQSAVSFFEVKPIIVKRKWFIATMMFIFLLIVGLITLIIKQRISTLIRIEEFKLQFFTNISHELRTPLTVILGPLQNYLKDQTNTTAREPLTLAHKNAQKMLKLVDQILEFRKIELGKVEHRFIHGDVIESIQETINLDQPLAQEHSQKLIFTYSVPHFVAWFDIEKIEKVVDNLLLNAIKYTPEEGEISVRIAIIPYSEKEDHLEIVFEDNGIGIPESKIQQIFEPYVRLKNDNMIRTRGTGLGLTFVKSLVDSMNGKIEVLSPTSKINGKPCGTKFIVVLPIYRTNPAGFDEDYDILEDREDIPAINEQSDKTYQVKPHILLVEDDQDILEYLSLELLKEFRVSTCRNGKTAYKKALKHIPDIIVTDVMMLHMDGRQLCEKIKSTSETSHIPVIMLTALKATEHELRGLEKGADDYLTKPIQIDILKQRIYNHLSIRSHLLGKNKIEPTGASTFSGYVNHDMPDDAFIDRFHREIEASYQNPLFDVKLMSKQLRMNRTTLYRKIKALTGKTPSHHIKDFRMNMAEKLIKEGQFNISEISDQVGFSEVSYFSTTFKKYFNCTPKKYQDKHREN